MESSNEIDLTLKLSTKIVQEEMEITYGRENSLQKLLGELPSNFQLELNKLEVAVLDPHSLGKSYIFSYTLINIMER